jgi:hypothetical protein
MQRGEFEAPLRKLIEHAWDHEVQWPHIDAWARNFNGAVVDEDTEQGYALYALSRFMYFGKRLVREMLRSLYRDHFEAPLIQRIRRQAHGIRETARLRHLYQQELRATRFIGVGNPAESGAHLLYYFRQVNHLPKRLFVDLAAAFPPTFDLATAKVRFKAREHTATRYVFFDDLVGSATQAAQYLAGYLNRIRASNRDLQLRFMTLFATANGLDRMNQPDLFDGHASCLFELDESYKAFAPTSRYFMSAPSDFDIHTLLRICKDYGAGLQPDRPLGYRDGQMLLGFAHNTPDNTLPVFWDEGELMPWSPVFVRYDKNYGGTP